MTARWPLPPTLINCRWEKSSSLSSNSWEKKRKSPTELIHCKQHYPNSYLEYWQVLSWSSAHRHPDRQPVQRLWQRIAMGRSTAQLFRTTMLTEAPAVLDSIPLVKSKYNQDHSQGVDGLFPICIILWWWWSNSRTEMEKAYKIAQMNISAPKIAQKVRISRHISIRAKTA